jgi:hypothetical protein
MNLNTKVVDRLSYDGIERRNRLRIYEQFPARVRAKDSDGDRFEIDAVLDNIGLHGLHMQVAREVGQGTNIFVVVRLTSSNDRSVFAPRLALQGNVLRAEPQPDGSYGVAVQVQRRRLLLNA